MLTVSVPSTSWVGIVTRRRIPAISDGYGLDIPDASDRYESYTINLDGRLIMV